MKISIINSNCSADRHFVIEECADAEINIELEFERIVSSQSRKQRQRDLCALIQGELSKYQWLISGSVNLELAWYLSALERQETDKVGDIDNITKPIIDSLTGKNGVLIDDAQIGSLHTFWMSRNTQIPDNLVKLKISFNNDECIEKNNLIFIQYAEAVCIPFNIDFSDIKNMMAALIIIKARAKQRGAAKKINALGGNYDHYLVCSSWDVHRTRINGFDSQDIYQLSEFKQKCSENGLNFVALLREYKNVKNRRT